MDNKVVHAKYNGEDLTITSWNNILNYWGIEKTVTFVSCDGSNPGTLEIKGTDSETGNIFFYKIKEIFDPKLGARITHSQKILISDHISQISDIESQFSDLKLQITDLRLH